MGTTGSTATPPWDVPVELVVRPAPRPRRGEGLELRVHHVALDPAIEVERALIGARSDDAAPRVLLVAIAALDGRDVLAGIVDDVEELVEAWPAARIVAAARPPARTGSDLAGMLGRLGSPLPVLVAGSELSVAVLRALAEVPLGTRVSYAQLAARAGAPRAVRAAARVMSTNVVPLVLPCHRIVPSSGGIGRYGWGADVKARLLELEDACAHEAVHRARPLATGAA